MIILAYSYLLLTGEFNASKYERTPLLPYYNTLSCEKSIFTHTSNTADLRTSTLTILDIINQKNNVRSEKIGQGALGYPLLCPKESLPHFILYLKGKVSTPASPLARIYTTSGRWKNITSYMIFQTIKSVVTFFRPGLGFTDKYVSALSLHLEVTIYLICSSIDSNTIKLIG